MQDFTARMAERIELWPTERLVPYDRNPRTHSPEQIDKIAASIAEFGFLNPILVDTSNGIIAGHGRLEAAKKLSLPVVPVVILDHLTETQKRAYVIADNKLALDAGWDDELLKLEMMELDELGYDLAQTGFSDEELAALLEEEEGDGEDGDADAVPETPIEPITKLGDVWQIGRHRLLCADSTVLANVQSLLEGERAQMTFTDPPYNVNYAHCARSNIRKDHRGIQNDNLGGNFEKFLFDTCSNILAVCDGGIYICMSTREIHTLYLAFASAGGRWADYVIWVKNHFTLGVADYHCQYEMILYGWKKDCEHYWCGARDQGDAWLIDKPVRNDLHPTMKPVELVERAVKNSSRRGEVVLDLFGGSGTTLIACEKTDRQARLMELDPKYCDVIVKRWEDLTGEKAERLAA